MLEDGGGNNGAFAAQNLLGEFDVDFRGGLVLDVGAGSRVSEEHWLGISWVK
jgi:hypothetical protein